MTRYRFEPASLGLALLIVVSVVSFDLVTKMIIVDLVMQPPRPIPVTSFLNLTLGFNSGISFGLFSDVFARFPAALIAGSMGIALFLLLWAAATKSHSEAAALGLISGGALGNIWDRLQRGAVVDFIDLYVGEWHWPAFNLADTAIVLGAAGLVIASLCKTSNQGSDIG